MSTELFLNFLGIRMVFRTTLTMLSYEVSSFGFYLAHGGFKNFM
jgi:hypothetical protein